MTTTDRLHLFLTRREPHSAQAAAEWMQRLETWQLHLNELYGRIQGYLQSYCDAGSILVARQRMDIREDHDVRYTSDKIIIALGGRQVVLTPIGAGASGAKGRVDMDGPRGHARLLLVDRQPAKPVPKSRFTRVGDAPRPLAPDESRLEWSFAADSAGSAVSASSVDPGILTRDLFLNKLLDLAGG